MGIRTEITQFDDIDGSTEGVRTVSIMVDGQQIEIDLSVANLNKLMGVLEPYLRVGRKVSGGTRGRRALAPTPAKIDTQAVREWAQANGHPVSEQGRIKKEVLDAYQAAH